MSFTGYSNDIDPDKTVENAPFWPDLNLSQFQAVCRLPAEYRKELLEERLKLTMVWANGQLSAWRIEQQTAGAETLDQVPVDADDFPASTHPLVLLYLRAVSYRAKALLLPDYATMMRKSDAINDAKEAPETADQFYTFALNAINDLQDKPKIHAELL